ncbi:hypothetical protein WAI453_007406 [Rhynchosporium graminicola]|uniref:Related to cyclin n=1 Tax=Rhynchosporium graminicola TaxID=2792576 RepID=A0A1E1LKQ6_9HELO|nr:related to cyclin [Rhynchosporium commune]
MAFLDTISNPLVTPSQITTSQSLSKLPIEIQDSIRFYTARLTQAAGRLLRLPQDITAKANVLLFRYWVIDGFGFGVSGGNEQGDWEFSDISAATLYLTAKISSSPRSLRSITNIYAFLLSPTGSAYLSSSPSSSSDDKSNPETYYLSESAYISQRNHLMHLEGQILNALGFETKVVLPHALAITYLQTLDVFNTPAKGKELGQQTIACLNTALLSPQMLYLTHQPTALATAAIYLAAREIGVKLPETEWWEVFDCEREELGFLVVAMGSLKGWVEMEMKTRSWGTSGMVRRADLEYLRTANGERGQEEDEEREMARMLDQRVQGEEVVA